MQLSQLASQLLTSRLIGDGGVEIRGVQADSRKAGSGDLFFCVPGLVHDGHDFAGQVAERGAAALVVERQLDVALPQLVVKDSRYAMAVLSAHFFGYPSERMRVVGVTGTNGKTTTAFLVEQLLARTGHATGLMGTIHTKIGDRKVEASRTTQEAVDLQRTLREMVDAGSEYCVMEVSSHALDLGRVKGTRFRTAIFTNLTQDHLDYHGTMENYRQAKSLFFSRLGNAFPPDPAERRYAVLNADDPVSEGFARITPAETITYGIEREADVRAADILVRPEGNAFELRTFRGDARVQTKLIGKFNVYNALAAVSVALAEGLELADIVNALAEIETVPGRMETVNAGQDFLVVVDYAHTPDGLENALSTIREFARGRIITVFGCGGDRDRTKRPIMGRIAAGYSDYTIVTSDNPRSENPEAILRDIEPGVVEGGAARESYELLADRREAIRKAAEMAGEGDVVLIAGKGHETYQIVGGDTHHFDDREEARAALERLARG